MWRSVEQNLGVTVASLPVLRPYWASLVKVIKDLTDVSSHFRLLSDRQEKSRSFNQNSNPPDHQDSDVNRLVPLSEITIDQYGIRRETCMRVEST